MNKLASRQNKNEFIFKKMNLRKFANKVCV